MRILVVDDHPIVRQGLVALLVQAGPDTVILEAGNAESALKIINDQPLLDIVIVDLVLPGMTGAEAIGAFGKLRPELPVVVLSSSEDPQDARRSLALGALGYVPKSASHTTLLSAVRMVMDGDIYVPPLILGTQAADPAPVASPLVTALTERQMEILRMVGSGESNKLIARKLNLSEKTVKAHISAIFRSLKVVNRTQAASVGRELGIF